MKILVACEFSGIVREAFRARGHDAWSCDLLDTEIPGQHIRGDVRGELGKKWDMVIAFPPCTALCCSGNRWYAGTQARRDALEFIWDIMDCKVEKLCIENPVGVISSSIETPSQIVQPWWFGHGEVKSTCLWLYGLPLLQATDRVSGRRERVWRMGENGGNRGKERSRTLPGMAAAMAVQWG
jgi:site-specific DNA-cytosine methylase